MCSIRRRDYVIAHTYEHCVSDSLVIASDHVVNILQNLKYIRFASEFLQNPVKGVSKPCKVSSFIPYTIRIRSPLTGQFRAFVAPVKSHGASRDTQKPHKISFFFQIFDNQVLNMLNGFKLT